MFYKLTKSIHIRQHFDSTYLDMIMLNVSLLYSKKVIEKTHPSFDWSEIETVLINDVIKFEQLCLAMDRKDAVEKFLVSHIKKYCDCKIPSTINMGANVDDLDNIAFVISFRIAISKLISEIINNIDKLEFFLEKVKDIIVPINEKGRVIITNLYNLYRQMIFRLTDSCVANLLQTQESFYVSFGSEFELSSVIESEIDWNNLGSSFVQDLGLLREGRYDPNTIPLSLNSVYKILDVLVTILRDSLETTAKLMKLGFLGNEEQYKNDVKVEQLYHNTFNLTEKISFVTKTFSFYKNDRNVFINKTGEIIDKLVKLIDNVGYRYSMLVPNHEQINKKCLSKLETVIPFLNEYLKRVVNSNISIDKTENSTIDEIKQQITDLKLDKQHQDTLLGLVDVYIEYGTS